MTETCAYIAGLIDADGWIGIRINNQGKKWQGHSFMVGIVNRDLLVLQWVQSIFGGSVRPRKRIQKSPHAKTWSMVYDWNPDGEGIERFLLSVIPYLRIKKRQAELTLEFLKTRQDRKIEYRLPAEVRRRREELFMEAKELNRVRPVGEEEAVH
jgi:hypothetical protein